MVMPGLGIPQDPGFTGPFGGVNVPAGDVSVMPQPSESRQPVISWNLCCTSTGRGAPPDAHHFNDDIDLLDSLIVDDRDIHRRHARKRRDLLTRDSFDVLRHRSAYAARARRQYAIQEAYSPLAHRCGTAAGLRERVLCLRPRPAARFASIPRIGSWRTKDWRASASRLSVARSCRPYIA